MVRTTTDTTERTISCVHHKLDPSLYMMKVGMVIYQANAITTVWCYSSNKFNPWIFDFTTNSKQGNGSQCEENGQFTDDDDDY